MQGFTPRYELTLRIERGDGETIIDATVGAKGTPEEISKAKQTIQKLLRDFTPAPSKGPALPPGYAPAEKTEEATPDDDPPEAPKSATPPQEPERRRQGVTGALKLDCPECHRTFGTFQREPVTEITCNCGHHIPLERDALARYRYSCPYCEKEFYGLTNSEDPDIEVMCVCKNKVALTWDTKAREYRN